MNFVLPPKGQVGYLDPEIAGEGAKVILSDGEHVSWNPPPARPIMPDWSEIKSIARYFHRTGYEVYPAWLYHPTEEPRLVKNADEAAKLGVCYRQATIEEKGRYGLNAVWDWQDDSHWRPQPHAAPKFDPKKPGQGKTYLPAAPNPANEQSRLLEALVPAVAAAVAQSLKATGPAAPATIDPKDWDAFLQFQAFQKASQALDVVKETASQEQPGNALAGAGDLLDESGERADLEAQAAAKGIKVDGRWSNARLKAELEKAAA